MTLPSHRSRYSLHPRRRDDSILVNTPPANTDKISVTLDSKIDSWADGLIDDLGSVFERHRSSSEQSGSDDSDHEKDALAYVERKSRTMDAQLRNHLESELGPNANGPAYEARKNSWINRIDTKMATAKARILGSIGGNGSTDKHRPQRSLSMTFRR